MRYKLSLVFILSFVLVCNIAVAKKKPGPMRVLSGSNIPSIGVALDASYDKKTDGIVPGYKILTVAIENNSINILPMDKTTDSWVLVDSRGKKHDCVLDLRNTDPKVYSELPEKLRSFLAYPIMIQVGETGKIDILYKDSVDLEAFKSLIFTSRAWQQAFEIVFED